MKDIKNVFFRFRPHSLSKQTRQRTHDTQSRWNHRNKCNLFNFYQDKLSFRKHEQQFSICLRTPCIFCILSLYTRVLVPAELASLPFNLLTLPAFYTLSNNFKSWIATDKLSLSSHWLLVTKPLQKGYIQEKKWLEDYCSRHGRPWP